MRLEGRGVESTLLLRHVLTVNGQEQGITSPAPRLRRTKDIPEIGSSSCLPCCEAEACYRRPHCKRMHTGTRPATSYGQRRRITLQYNPRALGQIQAEKQRKFMRVSEHTGRNHLIYQILLRRLLLQSNSSRISLPA